jgi:hypothetical protein
MCNVVAVVLLVTRLAISSFSDVLPMYGNPDCQASKSVAKHLVAVDADGCHH